MIYSLKILKEACVKYIALKSFQKQALTICIKIKKIIQLNPIKKIN